MKKLKDYIQESILDDIEVSLSTKFEDLYPIPTKKDFKKRNGTTEIYWYCKDFIQQYIRTIRLRSVTKTRLDEVDTMRIAISGYDNYVSTWLCIGNNPYIELKGVGLSAPNRLSNEKHNILALFSLLAKNPDKFKDLFEIHNTFEKEWDVGFTVYFNIDEVIEKLEKSK